MKNETDYENMSVFEQIKKGLEQCIAHTRGELSLKTTTLPMPPPPAGREKVIALRKKLKMSQSIFAAALNVSTKLVQSWEQGARKPDRGELRLIEILIKEPRLVSDLIMDNDRGGSAQRATSKGRPAARKKATAA